jgi:hypothetical protein
MTKAAAPAKDEKPAQELSLAIDFNDEIINGAAVTHNGARRTPEPAKAAQ